VYAGRCMTEPPTSRRYESTRLSDAAPEPQTWSTSMRLRLVHHLLPSMQSVYRGLISVSPDLCFHALSPVMGCSLANMVSVCQRRHARATDFMVRPMSDACEELSPRLETQPSAPKRTWSTWMYANLVGGRFLWYLPCMYTTSAR
jgi:hypothetical protein